MFAEENQTLDNEWLSQSSNCAFQPFNVIYFDFDLMLIVKAKAVGSVKNSRLIFGISSILCVITTVIG